VTNLVRQAKRRYIFRFLNHSLPSKDLRKNLESIRVKDSVDANIIYSPAELGSYYESLCSIAPPVTAHVMDAGTDESWLTLWRFTGPSIALNRMLLDWMGSCLNF
jgi:hypothetical protein